MTSTDLKKTNQHHKSSDPFVVEVWRGDHVESLHQGSIAVVDSQARVQLSWGDPQKVIYPRSAIKAFQALAFLESGAADQFNFTDAEIALTCASHGGEKFHVDGVKAMLEKCQSNVDTLECGSHWPMYQKATVNLAKTGEQACPLHNNCSGKHAGMIAATKAFKMPTQGYIAEDHPLQQRILGTIENICAIDLTSGDTPISYDGCSVPCWGLPLENIAFGFARFGTAADLPDHRAKAAFRIRKAVAKHPEMVAGSERFCSEVMAVLGERAFIKVGAEGVYCASLPEYGLGIALKCHDGATRAAEQMMIRMLDIIGVIEDEDRPKLQKWLRPRIPNWNDMDCGKIISPQSNF